MKGNTVMDLKPVKLSDKIGYKDKDGSTVEYQFKLSSTTDPVWRSIFYSTLGQVVAAKIHGNQLDITSTAASIDQDFLAVKSAMQTTNGQYGAGRQAVVEYAEKQDQERAEKSAELQRKETERRDLIQSSYARLEIE